MGLQRLWKRFCLFIAWLRQFEASGASDASTIYAEFDRQGLTADTVQNGVGPQSCSKYWSLSVPFAGFSKIGELPTNSEPV